MENQPDFHPFRSESARQKYLAHYDRRASHWPVPSEARLVDTRDGRTFVRISGPANAPAIVLLPGVSSSSLIWLPNIAELSERHRVYAIDSIFDFGRSISKRAMRSAMDLVNWLDELFTALRLADDINLVGISYGGWVASQYALRYPARLRSLVLLAPVMTVLPLRAAFIIRALLCLLPHRRFTKQFMYWLAADSVAENGTSRASVDAMIEDGYLGLRSYRRTRVIPPSILTDDELRALSVPTLFLVGENEKIYSPNEAVRRLNEVVPRIRTEIISGAGHDLAVAQSRRVNQRILNFLAIQPARAAKPQASNNVPPEFGSNPVGSLHR